MERYYFYFGVEIEVIAEPRIVRHPVIRKFYYERLAESLRSHGLSAVADSLDGTYRKHSEHYDKWFITKDGSLGNPAHPAIPLEAVSPVLITCSRWEREIDSFWTSLDEVFKLPRRSAKCGSHIHVSPGPNKHFTMHELKSIACGIVFYADNLDDILPEPRRHNAYCQKNWESSSVGEWYERGSDSDVDRTIERIWQIDDRQELKDFMQNDRRVLWNFEHVVPGGRCTGTIEFRGGRGLRGPNRTKWWIAFVLSFIQLCISKRIFRKRGRDRPHTDYFWARLNHYARDMGMLSDMAPDWIVLNESLRLVPFPFPPDSAYVNSNFDPERETILTVSCSSDRWEDTLDSDWDESDTSSIVSKGASEYSDSE